jgi:Asp-tRNA(Asn)/Glu-tRNA(Gln) amidotransferase A subunit family amidase
MIKPSYALTVSASTAALRVGAFTCEALTRALLDRVAATDANVQAWAHLDREHAIATARAIDVNRPAGPLAGIGIGAKDIIATADLPTQLGSPIFADAQPSLDAQCVQRLKRAGAFVLGKTVTTEFAYLEPGKTRNPWNAAHTPGGSSSGSAAAVALGQVAAALGTQTNGSVIRPAAYCGVVGFKPTLGLLDFDGVNVFSRTLDTLGVFARSVDDCALVAAGIADGGALDADVAASTVAPRLALLAEFPWVDVGAEQRAAMDAAVDRLRRAGATVTRVALADRWHGANLVHRRIMLCEAVQHLGALQDRERPRMSAKLNAALDEGRAIATADYVEAVAQRAEIIAALTEWLSPFDAVLAPSAPGPAPDDLTQTGDPSCCTLWSLAGFPVIGLPMALAPNGMPLGLQLAAVQGRDRELLAAARWCEARLPFRGLV